MTESSTEENAERQTDPALWLDEHGDALYAYAYVRLGQRQTAEDLVQDSLLAGIQAWDKFDGRSTVRTWLTGILKRKIVDWFRRQAVRQREQHAAEPAETIADSAFFQKNGSWMTGIARWTSDPRASAEQREFWEVFERCREKLSPTLRAVFVLREINRQSKSEVCKELDITPSNFSVRLFRARMNLRRCLELNWFNRESDTD